MLGPIVFVFLVAIHCGQSGPLLPSTAKSNKVALVYPINAQSERDLLICPQNAACNVIHKRFWLPTLVERLCRCPQRQECKWKWTDEPDNYTMTLDNKSQIKFCSDLSELPVCKPKNSAIMITTEVSNKTNTPSVAKTKSNSKPDRRFEWKNVTANCYCEEPHYWKLKPNSTVYEKETNLLNQTFSCSKLRKCQPSEFCGHVRTDTFSTYYKCSCPKKHYCISSDKSSFNIEEMLYNGLGYKAYCFPIKNLKSSKG